MWRVSLCHNWAPQANLVLQVFSIICLYLPVQSCEFNTGSSVLYENAVLEVMTKTWRATSHVAKPDNLCCFHLSRQSLWKQERGDKRFRNWTLIRTTFKYFINHTMKLYSCTHQKMVHFTIICTTEYTLCGSVKEMWARYTCIQIHLAFTYQHNPAPPTHTHSYYQWASRLMSDYRAAPLLHKCLKSCRACMKTS